MPGLIRLSPEMTLVFPLRSQRGCWWGPGFTSGLDTIQGPMLVRANSPSSSAKSFNFRPGKYVVIIAPPGPQAVRATTRVPAYTAWAPNSNGLDTHSRHTTRTQKPKATWIVKIVCRGGTKQICISQDHLALYKVSPTCVYVQELLTAALHYYSSPWPRIVVFYTRSE